MSSIVLDLRGWRPSWHTSLVIVSVVVVLVSLALSSVVPLIVTTVSALLGGTGFVLGVSASISAFLQQDAHADSDFWR